MTMAENVGGLFLTFSHDRLKSFSSRIVDCLGRLSEDQIWARGGDNENAVGNLVLHLCGNVRQWIGSGVGGRADIRDRDAEFDARGGVASAELIRRLHATVEEATTVLEGVTADRLAER